jgi:TRAP-type C4-dicarboxylate transport system permease small subunit
MPIPSLTEKLRCISKYLRQIGSISLAAMMFLTTTDVIGRYFFNSPILGAFEITEYLMSILIFSFLAYTQSEKGHISVDIVFERLPRRLQSIIYRFNHLVCLLMMILVTRMGVQRAIELKHTGEMSTLLKIPVYPFAMFLVLGCAVFCLEFLIDLFHPEKDEEYLTKER